MPTMVEMRDEQRARLLELAAQRGETGLSHLVRHAIDEYLARADDRASRVDAALDVLGSFDDEAARALWESVTRNRGTWR